MGKFTVNKKTSRILTDAADNIYIALSMATLAPVLQVQVMVFAALRQDSSLPSEV